VRGFSTAKFLPGSRDTVIVALKSAEDAEKGEQTAFITIYAENPDGSWRTLLEEQEIPGNHKYEGLEILSWGK
jgi:soluble calcium-activated nucleotidase 1